MLLARPATRRLSGKRAGGATMMRRFGAAAERRAIRAATDAVNASVLLGGPRPRFRGGGRDARSYRYPPTPWHSWHLWQPRSPTDRRCTRQHHDTHGISGRLMAFVASVARGHKVWEVWQSGFLVDLDTRYWELRALEFKMDQH